MTITPAPAAILPMHDPTLFTVKKRKLGAEKFISDQSKTGQKKAVKLSAEVLSGALGITSRQDLHAVGSLLMKSNDVHTAPI